MRTKSRLVERRQRAKHLSPIVRSSSSTQSHIPTISNHIHCPLLTMSLKDRISSVIYHEKQEPDSSLCAQHCLNSLLQDHIFEATDLADLARQLDELEAQAHGVSDIMQAPQEMEASSSTGRSKRQPSPPGAGRSNLNADRSRNVRSTIRTSEHVN